MEPHVHRFLGQLFGQFDKFISSGEGKEGGEGNGWKNKDGWLWLDILPWVNVQYTVSFELLLTAWALVSFHRIRSHIEAGL